MNLEVMIADLCREFDYVFEVIGFDVDMKKGG